METTCSVEGCSREVFATTYCSPHYQRLRNTGDVQADKPVQQRRPVNPDGKCQEDGCNYPTRSRRFCPTHRKPLELFCVAPGCTFLAAKRDLCTAHGSRLLRHGDLQLDLPVRRPAEYKVGDPCTANGCANPITSVRLGLCRKHDARVRMDQIRADPERLEARRAYQRAFKAAEYAKDPQRHNQYKKDYKKAWDAANPERAKAIRARKNNQRRVRENNAPKIPFTSMQLADRMRYWGNRCWMCHGAFDAIDHVKPLTKGGYEALSNLRPICIRCNGHKADRWPFPTSAIVPPLAGYWTARAA